MKHIGKILGLLTLFIVFGCSQEDTSEEGDLALGGGDPIVGQWFLTAVNDTDVSSLDCYRESYIRSDGKTIDFYLVDLLQDGGCEVVLNNSGKLTIQDDFYYIGEEAIEIYINGSELTWRVNADTLTFRKN